MFVTIYIYTISLVLLFDNTTGTTHLKKANFYGKDLLAPRPTPRLEDHSLSAVCDFLFNNLWIHLYKCLH